MLTPGEYKILKKISECQVITKEELMKMFDYDSSKTVVDTIINGLLEKEYITVVSPVGSKCFVITKTGMQALNNHE